MSNSIIEEIKEIYRYRSILRALVEKNLFGHYKNSFLGFAWHFVTPLIMMVVYYLARTYVKHSSMENSWLFIASAIFIFHFLVHNIEGGGCMVSSAGLVKKLYFPRALVPLAKVITSFFVCVVGYLFVLIGILVTRYPVNIEALLFLPVALALGFIFALGILLLLSAVVVYVRDVQYLIASISMVFFFLTPIHFVASESTGILSTLIWYNPLTYFVEMFHDILYWHVFPQSEIILISVAISFVTLIVGIVVFHKLKNRFVELI